MSSATTSPVVTDTKKTRAPTLSEKYSKFIQFGYYMMSQMQDTDSFTKEEFLNKIEMFATVDEQQTFIQGFLDNQKENKKSMRKDIQERKKANQPKKVKAPRKTKKETAKKDITETETEPSAAETQTDSVTATESQENLIENLTNELTEEPMIDKIHAAIEVAQDMTAKKPRAKKAATEKKPRVTKKKKETDSESTTIEPEATAV